MIIMPSARQEAVPRQQAISTTESATRGIMRETGTMDALQYPEVLVHILMGAILLTGEVVTASQIVPTCS